MDIGTLFFGHILPRQSDRPVEENGGDPQQGEICDDGAAILEE